MKKMTPVTPGPRATGENIVLIRKIEAVRRALRFFDQQLDMIAKTAAKGTPQQRAFDASCQKFLDALTSFRTEERLHPNHDRIAGTENNPKNKTHQKTITPSKKQGSPESSTIGPIEKSDGDTLPTLAPYDQAQLLLDREAAEARTQYENKRSTLLQKLEKIRQGELPAEQKYQVIEELNLVENQYSRIWQKLVSGDRPAEILHQIENSKHNLGKKRRKSARTRHRSHSPASRMRRNSSRKEFLLAIRELDREIQRQAEITSRHRKLGKLLKTNSHRNNSVSSERIYRTSGFRNPRAKK